MHSHLLFHDRPVSVITYSCVRTPFARIRQLTFFLFLSILRASRHCQMSSVSDAGAVLLSAALSKSRRRRQRHVIIKTRSKLQVRLAGTRAFVAEQEQWRPVCDKCEVGAMITEHTGFFFPDITDAPSEVIQTICFLCRQQIYRCIILGVIYC